MCIKEINNMSKILNDQIVISGMSGRFPLSDTIDEFAENLYNGTDMISDDNPRWPKGLYDMNSRMGKLKTYDRFDITFFGLMEKMCHEIDPQSRLLLEVTYEAIIDAGINPDSLRGTRTGVYIGVASYAASDGYAEELQPDIITQKDSVFLQTIGNMKALYANRVSFVFDFKGPSMIVDTACSSSLTAFNLAINDLRLGNVDYAIVGGTHMTFDPYVLQMAQESGVCSPTGRSSVMDECVDGMVKADTVVSLLLQLRPGARRVYARVLTSRVNCDGRKTIGMFHPSSEEQCKLMVMAYTEANIDPLKLTYFEGHLTGTKAGDPEEIRSIFRAYYEKPDRRQPLLVGSLKSNMGHAEGGSGLASLIKVLLAFENECIPRNINLNTLRHELRLYCPPISPVTSNMPYKPGMAAINNFGLGGVNAHLLVEPNYKIRSTTDDDCLCIADTIPRIVNICGRTEDSVTYIMDFIEQNPGKITKDFLALLGEIMKYTPNINSSGFPYRGSLIISKLRENCNDIKYSYKKSISRYVNKTRKSLWIVFPGLGGEWPTMAKALMSIQVFADKVDECHQILSKDFNVDLKWLILSDDPQTVSTMTNKFCSKTSIEIALFELIKSLDIIPDGIIGHSFGEIACAYADGCLTTREAMAVAYYRGVITASDRLIPKGLMVFAAVSKSEAQKLCSDGVYVVCNNAKDVIILSGPVKEMHETINRLVDRSISVRQLNSNDIPYHSKYLQSSAQPMIDAIKKYLPEPKIRSNKWLSTSLLTEPRDDVLKYASAEYFVYNLLNPVEFYERLKQIPTDAVVLELSPHPIFNKIIAETLVNSTYISLLKNDREDNNLDRFLTGVSKLYELGFNPSIEILYPKVEWPVARQTPSIASLHRWDHSEQFKRRLYPLTNCRLTASDMNVTVDINSKDWEFLADHCIDGNIIFPATNYLMLAWRHLAASVGKLWITVPVVFEDVQFHRATFLSANRPSHLKVRYFADTGDFVILEDNNIAAVGKMSSPPNNTEFLMCQHMIAEKNNLKGITTDEYLLERDDIRKELRVNGYDFGSYFRRLKSIRTKNFRQFLSINEWDGNFVTFLDSMIQSMLLSVPIRQLMVPVMVRSVKIDPTVFFDQLKRYRRSVSPPNKLINPIGDEKQNKFNQNLVDTDITTTERLDERFHKYQAEVPIYYNRDIPVLVTHGIEVYEIRTSAVSRKVDTQSTRLVLDSYEWMPNTDVMAIDVDYRKEIHKYIEVCKSLAAKVKQTVFNDMKCNFNYQLFEDNVINEYKSANNSKNCYTILHILDQLLTIVKDYNNNDNDRNIDTIKNNNKLMTIVADIYADQEVDINCDIINNIDNNERLLRTMIDMISENVIPVHELNVTEINLNNSGSSYLMDKIMPLMVNFKLIPTDVNYRIIVNKSGQQTTVSPLDIGYKHNIQEWDVNESIVLSSNHLIILRDSHQILDDSSSVVGGVEKFIQDMYDSIVPNGFLLAIFRYKLTEPEVAIKSLINPKNKCLTDKYLTDRIDTFHKIAVKLGFRFICSKFDTIGTQAILFRKSTDKPTVPNNDNIVWIAGQQQYNLWFDTLKNKLNNISDGKLDTIWLISTNKDTNINGLLGFINCLRLEPNGHYFKCIIDYDNNNNLDANNTIDFTVEPYATILANNMAINIIRDGKVGTYRHFRLPKYFDTVMSNNYFLDYGQHSVAEISGLTWYDSSHISYPKERYDFNNNKYTNVSVNVYCSGLVFRDVMLASGSITAPIDILNSNMNSDLGCEFAGRRVDTGERVMGVGMGCIASVVNTFSNNITPIPEHWSMEEAATVVANYSTLYYGLILKGNLQKGEKVLIHSGTGGIGQSAINICRHYNCDIYTTVGTKEKRQFLIKEYGLSDNKIFSSRDTLFKLKILELTEGKGVDICINSLAGDKLDASYQCMANGGRFLELGKVDMIQNKRLGMFDFLRDISFIGVAMDKKVDLMPKFFQWMHQNSGFDGCVKPITKTVFTHTEAVQAFRYMTTGKHIGKIVIKFRKEEDYREPITIVKPSPDMLVIRKTYFNADKCYIITGGLGGFGLELIHWMIKKGAKKFVLTSRSGVKTNYQKYVINRLLLFGQHIRALEVNIVVSTANGKTIDGSRQLLFEAEQLGPIGGVFHLALELNDCLLQNSKSLEKYQLAIDTKYLLFEHLDQLTRALSYKLDYFVVFSSVACGKGNAGQTNYGMGNALCERICEQRNRDGLHGLAIQYGPIGDVGAVVNMESYVKHLANMQMQRINSCCHVLDKLLQTRQPIVTSYVINTCNKNLNTKEDRVIGKLWRALGIDPDTTPDNMSLGEIGMESMFVIELQQELQTRYGSQLNVQQIKRITVKMLKDYDTDNNNIISQYMDQLRSCKSHLLCYRFQLPTDAWVRLNNSTQGKPVYLMPPPECNFAAFEQWSHKVNRPVIGLNWTRHMYQPSSAMKVVFEYYINLMQNLEPNGNYDVVGYLDGAYIAAQLVRKGKADRALIVDMFNENGLKVDEQVLNNNNNNDILNIIIDYYFNDIPECYYNKLQIDLKDIGDDLSKQIKRLIDELKELAGRQLVTTDSDQILTIFAKRLSMLLTYLKDKRNKFGTNLDERVDKMWAKTIGKIVFLSSNTGDSETNLSTNDGHKSFIRDMYLLPNSSKLFTEVPIVDNADNTLTKYKLNDVIQHKIMEILNNT